MFGNDVLFFIYLFCAFGYFCVYAPVRARDVLKPKGNVIGALGRTYLWQKLPVELLSARIYL